MPLNPALLEPALKAAVFAELQGQFISNVPAEHQQTITDLHTKLATAISKVAGEIINHIKLNMEATSVVQTTVSTIVVTAGSPTAQTGTGTGTGAGAGTITPGGFR